MGTRADFYKGRGREAEWLGSIAWDGRPGSIPEPLRLAKDEGEFLAQVFAFLDSRDDATKPADGWPWPWSDSNTTDYSYAFDEGEVWATSFGYGWFKAAGPRPDEDEESKTKTCVFPDMTARKNVALGRRSGLIVGVG